MTADAARSRRVAPGVTPATVSAAAVLVGLAVGVGAGSPVLALVLAVSAGIAFATTTTRRDSLLTIAPIGVAMGMPWSASGLAAVLVVRRRGSAPKSANTGWAAFLVGIAIVTTVPVALLFAVGQLQSDRPVLDVGMPPLVAVVVIVLVAAAVNSVAEELLWRRHASRATRNTSTSAADGGMPGSWSSQP